MQMIQTIPFVVVSGENPLPALKGDARKGNRGAFELLLNGRDLPSPGEAGLSASGALFPPVAAEEGRFSRGADIPAERGRMPDIVSGETTAVPLPEGADAVLPDPESSPAEIPVVAETAAGPETADVPLPAEGQGPTAGTAEDLPVPQGEPVAVEAQADALLPQIAAAAGDAIDRPRPETPASALHDRRFADLLGAGGRSSARTAEPSSPLRGAVHDAARGESSATEISLPAQGGAGERNAAEPAGVKSSAHGAEGRGMPGEILPELKAEPPAQLSHAAAPVDHQRSAGGAAPASGTLVHLPSGQTVPENRIVEQVVGRVSLVSEGEGRTLTLKLHPQELGEVTIDLIVEKDRVKAQLVAQSQQVQEVLEKHLPRLRSALEMQGLKTDALQVTVDDRGEGGRGFFQEHHRPSAPVRFALDAGPVPAGPEQALPAHGMRGGSGINVRV